MSYVEIPNLKYIGRQVYFKNETSFPGKRMREEERAPAVAGGGGGGGGGRGDEPPPVAEADSTKMHNTISNGWRYDMNLRRWISPDEQSSTASMASSTGRGGRRRTKKSRKSKKTRKHGKSRKYRK
jgi:hypothetical protein